MDRQRLCLIHGEAHPEAEARVPALDRGFLYGDGLFETVRVYGGRPFRLDDHWERLRASSHFLRLPVPDVDPGGLVARVLAANGLRDGVVRVTLSRGPLPEGPRPGGAGDPPGPPTLLVQVRPLPADLDRRTRDGVEARVPPWPLRARGLPLQNHKTLGYLPSVVALGAVGPGAEPLLVNTDGDVAEGATTNVFWFQEGRLRTPAPEAGCLPGVARAQVLALAAAGGLRAEEGHYPLSSLAGADEAFLTNSVVEVVPLVRLDGRGLGSGRPGPGTRRLQAAYREAVVREGGR